MKLPLSSDETHLLRELFDPRRAAVAFPHDTAEVARLHAALHHSGELDVSRATAKGLTHLLSVYLRTLAGPGAPVPAGAPLAATVDLADQSARLTHIHAQLVRHLRATE